MEIDEAKINTKIFSEIKKYEILKKSFYKLYESETKASKSRRENFQNLQKIQENDNNELKEIYNLFMNDMKTLEDQRGIHLNKIMDLILPVTNYYPEKLKQTKKQLEELSKLRKNKAKLEKSRNDVKNDDVHEVQRINGELQKSKNEEKKRGIGLEDQMCKFESDRVDDNKFLFLHFIHSEMKYHAAALEKMSDLFYKINEKDPRIEIEDFKDRYKIDFDLKNLPFSLDDIRKNYKKKKDEEQDDIDDVYNSKNSQIKKSVKKSVVSKLDDEKSNSSDE